MACSRISGFFKFQKSSVILGPGTDMSIFIDSSAQSPLFSSCYRHSTGVEHESLNGEDQAAEAPPMYV